MPQAHSNRRTARNDKGKHWGVGTMAHLPKNVRFSFKVYSTHNWLTHQPQPRKRAGHARFQDFRALTAPRLWPPHLSTPKSSTNMLNFGVLTVLWPALPSPDPDTSIRLSAPLLLSTHLSLTWNCALCGAFFQSQSPAMPMCVCNISFLYSYILTIIALSLRMSKHTLFGRGWRLACRHVEKRGRSARSGLTIAKGFQQAFRDY